MKKKTYVYSNKKQPVFSVVKAILCLFLRKPKIINLNEKFPSDALMIGPHMGKWGPMYLSLYFPKKFAIVGAHPMLGNYKERYLYLRNVLYIQKQHKGKIFSTIKSLFEAIFSKMIYKGMHIIPSYEDLRLVNTVDYVAKTMQNGLPTLIFPENSDEGYQLVMSDFHEGFITIAKFTSKKLKKDIEIYPIYNHVKRRIIVIGKPFTLKELEGKTNKAICDYAANKINELNPNLELDRKNTSIL